MNQDVVKDTYKSISAPSQGSYKDKGSKFLAFAYPVTSEEEVKGILDGLRKEYFDARHHCYAYRIGVEGEKWRINDDGEPSSTAGKPIFGQLLSYGLSDILIVVVRYFGGIKLGVPGLILAYRSAAADAIANGTIICKTATARFTLRFDYQKMNSVMKVLKDFGITPGKQQYDNECVMDVEVRLRDVDIFRDNIEKMSYICESK